MTIGSDTSRPPIAVVGVSALFPGSVNATGFWSDILAGTDLLGEVPPSHWLVEDHFDEDMTATDKTYGRRGGFLDEIGLDSMKFGIPPNLMSSTDTAQLLALIVAQRVLDDAARGQFTEVDKTRCSVILGVTSGQELLGNMASRMNRPMWLQGMRRAGIPEAEAQAACDRIADLHPEWTESTFPGLLGNVVAGRIANRLDLGGTNCVTDAACASSFSSLSMGINELYLGDSDMVIAGGVDTMNDIFMYMCFSKTPALSPTEDIRPFSDQADGTMLGEGLGMVALKRLDDAERDGNDIYCVINAVGSSSDGRSKSVYAPVSSGQARALDQAYDKAGYGPETVELVEAHGTGTVAGDAAEFGGLELAFNAAGREDRQWCALGSVKSQIGHTKAAAGAAGLFKVIMGLHHKVLPQTAKVDKPNPKLDLEASPFHLNTRTRPWIRGSGHERRGSVSSFGFGGSNFHVALSEYTGDGAKAPRLRTADVELVVLTGATGSEVIAQAKKHQASASIGGYLAWLAQTSQATYDAVAPARLAVLASDEVDLIEKLGKAIERIANDEDAPFSTPSGTHYGIGETSGEVAFVFPGQGSQYLFMGSELASQFGPSMDAWDTAADLDWHDEPLQDVVFPITSFAEGGEDAQSSLLTATQWAQPAIGATSASMLRLLDLVGLKPSHVGGHSFGEITALHAAGVLSETDMYRVARRRGELMAEAAQTPGSMTAVARSVAEVRELVKESGVDVVVANHNSPTQVVLSGATAAIEEIEAKLAEQGITAKRLPVATAFHSPVVSGASVAFTEFLDTVEFNAPTIPVQANETAEAYPSEASQMRAQLGRQLANPVRFVEMIESMYAGGARVFVEVGPSSILTGLVAKILKGRDHIAVPLDKKAKAGKSTGLAPFMGGVGRLVAAGVPMDLAALWSEYSVLENPHEIEQPKLVVPINGANYGNPYPPKDLSELVGPNPERAAIAPTPATMPSTAMPLATSAVPAPTPTTVAVPSPAVATAPAPQAGISDGTLAAYQIVQQQTAEAHAAYLNAMALAHSAYLDTAQQGFAALGLQGPGGQQLSGAAPATAATQIAAAAPVVAVQVLAATAPAAPAPVVQPVVVPEPIEAAVGSVAPVVAEVPASAGVAGVSRDDLMALLLDVVSEKTGYPSDMLSMEMELEADLGIDSIKRVEILSAMQDAVPELPEVDTSVMAELVTLGQIVDYMNGTIEAVTAPTVTPAAAINLNGSTPASAASGAALGRYILDAVEAPPSGLRLAGLSTGSVAVTDDGKGVASALVGLLAAEGVDAHVVTGMPDSGFSGLIFLGGLSDMKNVGEAIASNQAAFAAARALAQGTATATVLVTVSDLGGSFGCANGDDVRAWSAGLTGLARTASIEWPSTSVKALDVERAGRDASTIAAAIAEELLRGGPELEVGLPTAGGRVVLESSLADVSAGSMPLGSDDVIVVSGGGRGVTAATVIELAKSTGASFALLGRSAIEPEPTEAAGANDDASLKRVLLDAATAAGKPVAPAELGAQVSKILANREIAATVAAVEQAGGKARYLSVDITNDAAVADAVSVIRTELGPITGIVHGAGVLADRLIAEKTDDQFNRVFDTKIQGLRALLTATASDPISMLCFFSSVAARTGNNGQVDYAMANEILNKVAVAERARRGDSVVVKSLGWGPWAGGMVSPSLKAHFESMGVTLIPLDVGAKMLVDEIASNQGDQVELVLGGGVLPEATVKSAQGANA